MTNGNILDIWDCSSEFPKLPKNDRNAYLSPEVTEDVAPWLPTARGTGQAPPNWSASSGPESRESAHRGWSFSAATLAAPSEPRHRGRGERGERDTWTAAFFGPGESLKIVLKHLGNGGFCSDKSPPWDGTSFRKCVGKIGMKGINSRKIWKTCYPKDVSGNLWAQWPTGGAAAGFFLQDYDRLRCRIWATSIFLGKVRTKKGGLRGDRHRQWFFHWAGLKGKLRAYHGVHPSNIGVPAKFRLNQVRPHRRWECWSVEMEMQLE